MNKRCSERAPGLPPVPPPPPNKRDLGVCLVAAFFCAPSPDSGITFPGMGLLPCKTTPQRPLCLLGHLERPQALWTLLSTPTPTCPSEATGRGLGGTWRSKVWGFGSFSDFLPLGRLLGSF